MGQGFVPVHVECYAGYRGEQTPRRIHFQEQTVRVEKVLDQWVEPEHRYFKVRTEDGATWLLRVAHGSLSWEIAATS
ncbi:MAG: hypothetical protein D6E12_05235 [Desulfovibrio sp.]|nr:MAG: hypothetical protein D6E12_05235 [Desulfovibrio sp.]